MIKKFNFPYVNQADILKIGMAGSRLCSSTEICQTIIEEELLIQKVIGELYEDES